MRDKVLIVGAGAIGAFYGSLLARAGAEVSVVCRSDYEVVGREGFALSSHQFGDWRFRPLRVLRCAREYKDAADYVILCSKVTPDIDRPALVRDAVGVGSTVVFIQNGVEIEAEMQQAFPGHEVISGLAFVCCNRIEPGRIKHLAYGKLILGNVPGGVSPKVERLRDLFLRAGMECSVSEDIVGSRWQKCVWNAPFNPLSVLSGGLATREILQTQERLVRDIMAEVCAIARACGHALTDEVIQGNIALTRDMPPYKTSMLLDFQQGHRMEIEAILGNAVRAGRREGVACPRLETLYGLMQLRELQRQALPVGT